MLLTELPARKLASVLPVLLMAVEPLNVRLSRLVPSVWGNSTVNNIGAFAGVFGDHIRTDFVGGATSGIVGGLAGIGIPDFDAKQSDGKIRGDYSLIAVHIDDSGLKRNAGAEDIEVASREDAPMI